MLKNYFLIAVRNIKKDYLNTIISLTGLIVGLACVFVIIGYVRYETSFDKHYENSTRIYQVINHIQDEEGNYTSANIPTPLAPTLKREIPEIVAQTSMSDGYLSIFKDKGVIHKVARLSVDDDFFSIFDFKFVRGNAQSAFQSPNSIVLTENGAKDIFGKLPSLGTIIYNTDSVPLKLTGLIENLPSNTFFSSNVFMNHPEVKDLLDYSAYTGTSACIMIGAGSSISQVKRKLQGIFKKYQFNATKIDLLPVTDIHLKAQDIRMFPENYKIGNIKYVYVYGSIALLILLIGCFNFINLTIARSMDRAREVGIRKLYGAQKRQLIGQFVGESMLFFMLALPLAMLLAVIVWHPFTLLLHIDPPFTFLINLNTIVVFLLTCFIASVICSTYPALRLSRLNPANSLKGGASNELKVDLRLRKVLIVLQFGISLVLVMGTFVFHAQLHYLNNQKLGFNKSNLVVLGFHDYGNQEKSFKNEILRNPSIIAASVSKWNVTKTYGNTVTTSDALDSTKGFTIAIIKGDEDFIKTLQVPIIDEVNYIDIMRPSTIGLLADSMKGNRQTPVYISTKFANALHIKGNPVGQSIKSMNFHVLGLIGDFKGLSLKDKNPLSCISIQTEPLRYGYLYVRISGDQTKSTIKFLGQQWQRYFPKSAFDYSFVNDRIAHMYDRENRLTKLFNIFAFLAITISSAGLFSLVSLMVRKRTKEIGIRKVMGATISSIVFLISLDFLWLLVIAFLIAMPLAYYGLNQWLQGYATKTTISWWLFIIAGALLFMISFISILFKSILAAKANPVDSLRNE